MSEARLPRDARDDRCMTCWANAVTRYAASGGDVEEWYRREFDSVPWFHAAPSSVVES